ncbi:MAG: RagB/SusD family nutrient uptake outer membrane protein [Bacteroidota bacterium]
MKKLYIIAGVLLTLSLDACESFVELDTPKTQIVTSTVFSNDAGARASVSGILSQMMNGTPFSGNSFGITVVAGLSADELNNNSSSSQQISVYNNNLSASNNSVVSGNWNDMYQYIYEANSIIEGAESSTGLSRPVRDQVIGEARFIRAFCYFYLINLYGDVPLITSTDYRVNRLASRTAMAEVYGQIEQDLIEAQKLLLEDYSFSLDEKIEPNKWAATALLARSYLYEKKWNDAEIQSAAIINSELFSLTDLESVFLANSDEAIWQLMPVLPGYNTNEGMYMIIASTPTRVSASTYATSVFEPGDGRESSWLGSYTTGGKTYRYAYKYKIRATGKPLTEYYMVFRLAEQYLIRAEARAMQNNLPGAVDDINVIRERAGLDPIDATGLSQQDVLDAIIHERRAELFIEWGHRWFDLKRSGTIDAVLGAVKSDWQSKDALFPIPQTELNADPNLVQNP